MVKRADNAVGVLSGNEPIFDFASEFTLVIIHYLFLKCPILLISFCGTLFQVFEINNFKR